MRRLLGLLTALVLVLGVLPATSNPAAGFTSENVDFIGHGWGHGRGMGQYGALGYAVNHGWNYGQILQHFYGNTTPGSIGQPLVSVHLTRANPNGGPTHIQQEKGQMVNNKVGGAFKAARVSRVGPNLFTVERGESCAGPWQAPVQVAGPLVFAPTVAPASHQDLIQVCEAAAQRWYRGNIEVHDASGIKTFNKLAMDDYLLGVVPRESPASWGDLGEGKGLQALKAQAVAARSYAFAENRFGGPATTCDTIACQVYLGFAVQDAGGFRNLEDPRTNRAVGETAGEVRKMSDGSVARTEFSSSTGGYTAGPDMGSRFPAVADAGDSISLNPNHTWKATIPVAEIEAKYPGRGSLEKIEIPLRNGVGEWGGRVKVIRLVFSGGAHELTGDQFRRDFALKSNWFTVSQFASFAYHVLTADGRVHTRGGAPYHGDIHGRGMTAADLAEAPGGYWILATNGRVTQFGSLAHHGDVSGKRLNSPPNGITAHPSGKGYWIVAGDGGVFTFGPIPFHGSTGHMRLNQPVVGMASTPTGDGYWLVALDGGVFTFEKAGFYGSTGNIKLNQPVFAMAPTKSGKGYWLIARDGGVFTFGDAGFHGSLPGRGVRQTAVEMLPSPTGNGYLIVTREGQVHAFGDATSGGGPFEVGYPSPTVAAGVPR